MSHNLILASSSPYRKALLKRLVTNFETISSEVDEDQVKMDTGLSVQEKALKLAELKAHDVFLKNPRSIVIGSDQICAFQDEILSKPLKIERAFETLMKLQGSTHQLITAYAILGPHGLHRYHVQITNLKMKSLSAEQINRYLLADRPLDCAGSYKLESFGIKLFSKIDCDDESGIIGLPLIQLGKDLESIGLELL